MKYLDQSIYKILIREIRTVRILVVKYHDFFSINKSTLELHLKIHLILAERGITADRTSTPTHFSIVQPILFYCILDPI